MKNAIKNYIAYNSKSKIIFDVGVFMFVATLPLSTKINTIMLWVFLAGSLQYVSWTDRVFNFKKNKIFIFSFLFLFLTFIVTLLDTENVSYGLRKVEKVLTLVLIPVCVLTHNRKDFNLKYLFIALGVGLVVLIVICWSVVFYSIYTDATPLVQSKYFFQWVYASWNLVKPVGGHPSYIGVLIALFLAALLKGDMFANFRKKKTATLLISIPVFFFLFQIGSRIAMITLFVLILIYFLKSITIKNIIKVSVAVTLLTALSYQFDFLGRKFDKMIDGKGNIKFERYERWTNILETLSAQNVTILGVGYGDAPQLYETAYLKGKHYKALTESYNAHNQFIEFIVGSGIIGLVLYLYLFILFAFKTKLEGVALHFFVAFILFSLSESILERSQGVFMLSFLMSVLYITKQQIKSFETKS